MRRIGSLGISLVLLTVSACGDSGSGESGGGSTNQGDPDAPMGFEGLGEDDQGIPGSTSGDGRSIPLSAEELEALRNDACTGWRAEAEPDVAALQLVVDTSGSMGRDAPGSNRSKWAITRDALQEAIDGLPASTSIGMLFYPDRGNVSSSNQPRDPDVCVNTDGAIPMDLLGQANSMHRERINRALSRIDPEGGTPTHDAYRFALQSVLDDPPQAALFMLVITDGQPTYSQGCVGTGRIEDPVDEQPIIDEIAGANADGIGTFVIGSPGSEDNAATGDDARPWLSEAATEGGTAADGCSNSGPNFCHFDMTEEPDFGAALSDALANIAGQIVQCTYDLPPAPDGQTIDTGLVNVIYESSDEAALITRNTSDTCDVGWDYGDGESQIVLCPDTCNAIKADPQSRVELLFGCDTVIPIR